MKQQKQDDHVMIIIQPTPYKFMIFMDASLQQQVDKLFQKQSRNLVDKQQYQQIECIKEEVKGLRPIINDYQNQQNEIESLKAQLQNQIKAINSKEQILKNIEDMYMGQMEEIKNNYEQRQHDLVAECEKLRKENQELETLNNKYLTQNDALLKANNQLQLKLSEIEGRFVLEEKNNVHLNQQLEQLKDIRGGSLIIQGAYRMLKQQYIENNIYTLLTNKYKNNILKCLEPRDLYSLLLTSKQMYFIIQNNRQLMSYIVNYRTQALIKDIKFLRAENNYFNDMINRIPEEIIKVGIAKFLVFKFNVGQYMTDVFNDAFELIEGKMQSQQPQQQLQQTSPDTTYINEDLLGLSETDEQQQKQSSLSNISTISNTVQHTTTNLFSKIKSYTQTTTKSPQTEQKQKKSLSDLSIQIRQDFQEIDSLILDAIQVPYLKVQVMQTKRDMAELIKRSQQINQQLFQTGTKCIPTATYQPKFTMQDFMSTLQKTFSKLVANSHYLQLESQQLQQLNNYFATILLQQHKTIYQLKSKMDDQCEEIQSLKEMKYFVQDRAKRFEERIIKSEEQILNISKQNYEQKQHIILLSKREKELEDQNKEREQKIQALIQAIKQVKVEKEQVEGKLNSVLNNFKNMKIALSKCL